MGNSSEKGNIQGFKYQLIDTSKSWYPFMTNTKIQNIEFLRQDKKLAKIKYGSGVKYIGQIKREQKIINDHGKGTFSDKNQNAYYEGEWFEGKPHGNGKYQKEKFFYKGEFQKGKFDGDGKLEYSKETQNNWFKYYGEFVKGLRQGKGCYESTMIKIKGQWKSDELEGSGMIEEKSHRLIYYGTFQNNNLNGYGERTITLNGRNEKYTGFFRNNLRHGFGVNSQEDGKIIYVGTWKDGKKDGEGIQKEKLQQSETIKQGQFKEQKLIREYTLEWAQHLFVYEGSPYRKEGIQDDPLNSIIEYIDEVRQDDQGEQNHQNKEVLNHFKLLLKY